METWIKVILMGIVIAIIGFAYAFSFINEEFVTSWGARYGEYNLLQYVLMMYPNLISGVVIGIGGLAIAFIGFVFARQSKSFERTCQDCGQKLKNEKYCPNCGKSLSSTNRQ